MDGKTRLQYLMGLRRKKLWDEDTEIVLAADLKGDWGNLRLRGPRPQSWLFFETTIAIDRDTMHQPARASVELQALAS